MQKIFTKGSSNEKKDILPRDIDVINILSYAKISGKYKPRYLFLACMVLDMQRKNEWRQFNFLNEEDSLYCENNALQRSLVKAAIYSGFRNNFKPFKCLDRYTRLELTERFISQLKDYFPRQIGLQKEEASKDYDSDFVLPSDFSVLDVLMDTKNPDNIDLAIILFQLQQLNKWCIVNIKINGETVTLPEYLKRISCYANNKLIQIAAENNCTFSELLKQQENLNLLADSLILGLKAKGNVAPGLFYSQLEICILLMKKVCKQVG